MLPITWPVVTEQGTTPITSYEVQYQRTDDDDGTADGAADTADADDWDDAMTGVPSPPAVRTFTQMKAPGLSAFSYRVRAVNGSGAGAWSAIATTTINARGPDAPVLTATAVGDDEIMLQWTIPGSNGTDISGFDIRQWDSVTDPANPAWGAANLLTGGDDATNDTLTVFIVGSLNPGTKYYFRIQALPGGEWSATNMADAASATTMAGVPLMPTLNVGAGTESPPVDPPTDDSITLWWVAPDSGGSDILGYQLRVWDGSTWALEDDLAATATMYKDEDLAPGTRYYYILAARNSSGYGPWSDAASAMTVAGNPEAPTLMATATGADSIQLTWNVPNANGATISGYQLQRWDPDAGTPGWADTNLLTGATIADADAETVTEFEDTGLMAGTKYYYRIRALPQPDATSGWSATNMSDATSATTHGDTPGRPTWEAAAFTATDSSLELAWGSTTPTPTGGSAITGYKIQVWSGGRWVDEATLGVVLTYTDMNLAAGTKYYYRVRAINSQGEGLWSATKAGTTSPGTPDAPVLTATATGMTTVQLIWTVPDDNGVTDGITGYELQRWEPDADNDPATPAAWGTDNLLGTDTDRTLFVDSGRMPGVTYYYRIRATASTAGGWSTIKSATTDPGAPGRPVMETPTADGQNAIDLTWSAAPANGSAIVRYELQVWNPGTSMWDYVRNDLPSTRLSYKHSGLTAGTKYVYRVRGVNRAAENNGFGKWSVITFATTAE